jgi:hypothetical protein
MGREASGVPYMAIGSFQRENGAFKNPWAVLIHCGKERAFLNAVNVHRGCEGVAGRVVRHGVTNLQA